MHFLIICFLTVLLPFLIEKFYYGIKFGPFFLLFCVFMFQVLSLISADFFLGMKAVSEFAPWFATLMGVLGGVSLMTIALTPLLSLICIVGWSAIKCFEKFRDAAKSET